MRSIRLPSTVKASALFTLCGILQKGVSLIVVPIYTRIMPSEAYGIYSVFFSWYQLIMIFTTLNMWNYLMNNGMTDYGDRKWDFISALIGLSSVITLIWMLVYIPFSGFWEKWTGLTVPMMALMFAELLVMPAYEYWCAMKRYFYEAGGVVVTAVIIAFATPLVTIPLILNMDDQGLAAITGKCIVPIIVYGCVEIRVLLRNKPLFDGRIWIYALNFNIPLIPHFLSMMVLTSSDRIMIERICGASDAAVYSVAYQLAFALLVFNSAVLSVFIPYTYRSINEGNEKKVGEGALPLIFLIGILNFSITLMAPEIIYFLAPQEYQKAVYVIPSVAMSNLLMFLFNLFANIEYYFKETKLVALASVISSVTNIILNFLFIPVFGFIAAAYTTVFCYGLFSLFHYLFMLKVLDKYMGGSRIYDGKKMAVVVGGFATLSFMVTILYKGGFFFVRYLLLAGIIIAVFLKRKEIRSLVLEPDQA